jgi:hypothetical protein
VSQSCHQHRVPGFLHQLPGGPKDTGSDLYCGRGPSVCNRYGIPPAEELLWCNMTEFNRGMCDHVTISRADKLLYYSDFVARQDSAVLAYDVEMDVVLSCLKKPRTCFVLNGFIEVTLEISFPNCTKSILYEPFNETGIRMFETGITEKLKSDYFVELRGSQYSSLFSNNIKEEMRKRNFYFENKTYFKNVDEYIYFSFSASHLQMAFYILAFGNGVSFVVFIGEIIYNFFKETLKFPRQFFKITELSTLH